MNKIDLKLNKKLNNSLESIRKVYEFKNESIPFIINDVNYWLDGENPELMPVDYYDVPSSMVNYQLNKINSHLQNIDDYYIPFLHPWYGTCVVPSALGCEFIFPEKGDPSLKGSILNNPEDIKRLRKPNPYKDGLMPRVLKTIDYMVNNTDLPVSVTDTQGPLNIALSICGLENLYIWMYTEPIYAHKIMSFCTEVLIDWIKVQKYHAKQELDKGAWPHGIALPAGFGGVCLSDDDCTTLSAELYKEFVVPYNSCVLKEFGGGTIHFCGSAMHQLDNFLVTDGLSGINNFCMGNFEQIYKMQELFDNKIVIMACDFAPLDCNSYIDKLFSKLKSKGTIIGLFISSSFALNNGTYTIVNRPTKQTAIDIYNKLVQVRSGRL